MRKMPVAHLTNPVVLDRMSEPPSRRAGRTARRAARAAGPAVNPAPPGQNGGRYRPLGDRDLQNIYHTALRLLSDLGMGDVPDRLRQSFEQAGGQSLANGRISIPSALVEDAIAAAPETIVLHGRDPRRSIEVGRNHVHFGTGGAAVLALDRVTKTYRAATISDLHEFTRLQDALTNISWFTRCCIATDLPDERALDINTAYALLHNTTKPVGTAFSLAQHVEPIVEMFDIAAGETGAFSKRPFAKAHISPVISPMRFGADAVETVYACIAHNMPISCITAAQAGATAPATLAGFLAQSLAETLASLVMVHAIKPGHPMIFSNWPLVIDLRSGAFTGGGGEIAVLNAASAQLSNWLGLVSGVAACMTDAKVVDAQYGAEKGTSSLAAALSGANWIYESAGMTSALLGASFEGFVLDDEMHAATYRILRGIEVTEETLGYDAICHSVLGDGHFLGGAQTIAAMERDYVYPALADRDTPAAWQDAGAQDAWDRAARRVDEILATHRPQYLSKAQDDRIRSTFGIRFP